MRYLLDFLIDGMPIITPDANIAISLEDLDSEESGRDEAGYMHRIVLREGVRKVPLSYAHLQIEEYLYMESLFKGKSTFRVDCRTVDGNLQSFTAYRAKHSITVHNARTGEYRNYNFSIIEC